MSSNTQPQYAVGDVVNGHVLTTEGAWVPAPVVPPTSSDPQRYSVGEVANGHRLTEHDGWQPMASAPAVKKKHTGLKVVGGIVVGLLALVVIASALGGGSNKSKDRGSTTAQTAPSAPGNASAKSSASAAPKAVNKAPAETVAQANARRSATDYLAYQSFSRKGLIAQLKFEGFSTADSTYGTDAIHANWYAQAVKSAKSYLDTQSFSRTGLIEQLKFEGFTAAQAKYGVSKTGL